MKCFDATTLSVVVVVVIEDKGMILRLQADKATPSVGLIDTVRKNFRTLECKRSSDSSRAANDVCFMGDYVQRWVEIRGGGVIGGCRVGMKFIRRSVVRMCRFPMLAFVHPDLL